MPDKQMVAFRDFTGGLNTDKADGNLAENELRVADNVDFSERGGLQKRKDTSIYEDYFTQQVERVFEWNTSDGTTELMAVLEDGSLVRVNTGETIFQLFGTHISWFVLQEYLYLVDGNNYYRIDDETFNYETVPEQDVSGIREYGENFQAELDKEYELEYDDIQTDSETVSLFDDPDTTFERGTDYEMSIEDYEEGIITPLSSGTMVEGEEYYIDYEYEFEGNIDLEPIRKCRYIIRHPKSFRIFAARNNDDPDAIYYSEYNQPDNFKATSVIHPTTNDGPVQGIEILDEMLLVFYRNSIWAWRGLDPAQDAVWEKLPIKHGTYNHRTLETAIGAITFLDNNGIYALSPQKGTQNITDNKVTNEIKSISNKNEVHSIFDAGNNRYLLAYSDNTGRNDKILTFDWELGAFARWTGLGDVNDFCYTQDGELLMATDGAIKKLNQDYGNNNIDLNVLTRTMTLQNPYLYKLIENLFLTLNNYTNDTEATINIDDLDKLFDITNDITRNPLHEKGVEIQVELSDNSTENIILYDYGLEFKPVRNYREEL